MLCAGYVPHDAPEYEMSEAGDELKSIQEGTPMDPLEYLPPNYELYSDYFRQLTDKEAAPPLDMVKLLSLVRRTSLDNIAGGRHTLVEVRRMFNLMAMKELQWLLIVGNAVGLPMPALVPFGLLDKLSSRLINQPESDSESARGLGQSDVTSALGIGERAEAPTAGGLASEAKPTGVPRKPRERQPQLTTHQERGFYTNDEVAGLINLLPDTLNKYAREGRTITGYTPFKRQNGKSWHWRNNQQQAAYEISATADKPKHRVK